MKSLPAVSGKSKAIKVSEAPHRKKDTFFIFLFLLPALILFLLFVIYPIFRSVYYSTFNWNGLGPAVKNVGINNYLKIVSDEVFLKAVKNVLVIIVCSLGIQLPLAMLLAVLVGRDLPGRGIFRTIFFLPYVLSEVNAAIMWMLLYNADPDRGLFNGILLQLHMQPISWLGDMSIVLFAVSWYLPGSILGFTCCCFLRACKIFPPILKKRLAWMAPMRFKTSFTSPYLY